MVQHQLKTINWQHKLAWLTIMIMMASSHILKSLAFSPATTGRYSFVSTSHVNEKNIGGIQRFLKNRDYQYSCSNSFRIFSSSNDYNNGGKARLVFLGTPEVAADSLKTIYEESKKEDW